MIEYILKLIEKEAERRLEEREDKDLVAVLFVVYMDLALALSKRMDEIRKE